MLSLAVVVDWNGCDDLRATLARLMDAETGGDEYNADIASHIDGRAALGQRQQPLVGADKHVVLVSDARIDNRAELLGLLPGESGVFVTLSDAELILAAYRQWGPSCPEQLVGDFAFVLWDARNASLLAACDGMNMRTLCYMRTSGGLCLASRGQQLRRHPEHRRRFNELALAGWISGRPDPRVSMFEGIEVLPPGHALQADATGVRIRKFWDIDPTRQIRYRRIQEYQEHLQALLRRSVTDRLRSTDAVVASQMSGGMDSTTVTALANQAVKETNQQLLVISHSYRSLPGCDETDRIKETLQHLGISNSRFLAAEQHANLDFRELYPPTLESPGTVLSPRYADEMALLKAVGASVLLTGSGGDEMTWGHSLSYSRRLLRGDLTVLAEVIAGCREMNLPVLRTLRQLFIHPFVPAWLRQALGRPHGSAPLPEWVPKAAIRRLGLDEPLQGESTTRFRNPALQARYDALKWSSTINSVRSYGQVGATYGIDVRHPFFDTRLAEFSFAIPDDLWLREGYQKWLLRRTMDGVLPHMVCWNRQKVIFDGFFAGLVRNQAENVRAILADTRLQDMGLLDTGKLLDAFDRVMAGRQGFTVDVLYALMVQVWLQKYWQC